VGQQVVPKQIVIDWCSEPAVMEQEAPRTTWPAPVANSLRGDLDARKHYGRRAEQGSSFTDEEVRKNPVGRFSTIHMLSAKLSPALRLDNAVIESLIPNVRLGEIERFIGEVQRPLRYG
jgi:hypothetical protein